MKKGMVDLFWRIAGFHPLLAKIIAGAGFMRANSYLCQMGWYKSFQKKVPMDSDGKPIPWYSYPAVHFLKDRVTKEMSVFEFGCGYSTLWWGERVANVTFCEHYEEWFTRIKGRFGRNVIGHLKSVEDSSYQQILNNYKNRFDVIVIDGVERVACGLSCLGALKEDGVVIWDNSDRAIYQEGFDFLKQQGFRALDFEGLGAIVMIPTRTTIFYRPDNCLNI